MLTCRRRLERIERELKFRIWVQGKRLLEGFSAEQLLAYAERCEIPCPLPRKVPSKFDGLGRKAVMRLFERDERLIRIDSQAAVPHTLEEERLS